ncbi:MAG: hypothetical protein EBR30_14485 [Cytophagia bacterium]|nr:hypothetical protein [Cytophagia bacterium]NBW36197.1 hypothetical protein [Cytophagia bacterium]
MPQDSLLITHKLLTSLLNVGIIRASISGTPCSPALGAMGGPQRNDVDDKEIIMKILYKDERYNDYVLRQFHKHLRRPATYIYGTISIFALGLYWYQENLFTMLKVFFLLTTAFSITFLLSEAFSILTTKEIEKNKLITLIFATSIFLIVTNIYFDTKVRYWSVALGIILFIPVLITWTITKVRMRL